MGARCASGAHASGPDHALDKTACVGIFGIAAGGFEENTCARWKAQAQAIVDENNFVQLGRDFPRWLNESLKALQTRWNWVVVSCIEKIFGRKGYREDALLRSSGVEFFGCYDPLPLLAVLTQKQWHRSSAGGAQFFVLVQLQYLVSLERSVIHIPEL